MLVTAIYDLGVDLLALVACFLLIRPQRGIETARGDGIFRLSGFRSLVGMFLVSFNLGGSTQLALFSTPACIVHMDRRDSKISRVLGMGVGFFELDGCSDHFFGTTSGGLSSVGV